MEHAILHETIDGQQVNFYPETGFDDVMQTDGNDEITLRMVLEGMDAAIALLQNGLAKKANAVDVYTKAEINSLLNNKANSSDLSNYLPLSGGTMSGDVFTSHNIAKNSNNGELDIFGGNGWDNGAVLCLRGKGNSYEAGSFELGAYDDNGNHTSLFGSPDGRLYWGSKDVSCIDSSGANYIRYTNGLQLVWGYLGVDVQVEANGYGTTNWTYPMPFAYEPRCFFNSRHDRFNVGVNVGPIGTTGTQLYYVNTSTSNSFFLSGIDCFAIGYWK